MGIKIIANNKRASFDYFLSEKTEAGIVLQGTEVKSLRLGKVSLTEAYVQIDRHEEVWLYQMTIPHYKFGNIHNHNEARKRKLLLNKKEIKKLALKLKQEGHMTIIPTKIYFKDSRVKVEIALGKGKKTHDKRQDMKKKDAQKSMKEHLD